MIVEMERNGEYTSGKISRFVTNADHTLIYSRKVSMMDDDIEAAILDCGHYINPYVGFGVCKNCKTKNCSHCMLSWAGDLLCGKCFYKMLRGKG